MKTNEQEFAAIIAEAENLKFAQQKELPAVLIHNRAAAMCYDKYALKIVKFIHEKVIPTQDADVMLAVSLAFAKIELRARPDDSLLNSSLQNSVAQCTQAIKSRDQNMRDLAFFTSYEASYQDSQRTPRTPTGVPIDAVHKFASAEHARHNNAQMGRTSAPALIEEAKANIDLCEALLHQHKIEQRDWMAKLQEQQNSASLNPQDLAAGEERHQLVTDASGKEYYQFAHRDEQGNPFYCEAPTLDECHNARNKWTITKYLDGKVENDDPIVKAFAERSKALSSRCFEVDFYNIKTIKTLYQNKVSTT